ncbi:MAG TPA: S8 family serine peptidase [Anaerolineae bacterium]|nr:S8 family serine peptidase [Anaerolineae bacterium]
MNIHRPNLSTQCLTIVLALSLLAACVAPATPVPPQPPADSTKPAAQDGYGCGPVDADFKPEAAVAGAHYILNQVIITGPASGVQEVVKTLNAKDAGLGQIQTCSLGHLLPEQPVVERWSDLSGSRGPVEHVDFPPAVRAELTTNLYSLPLTRSVEELIVEINALGRENWVFADPNYLTGPLDANPVSPCAVAQDPFEVGGSPFEVGGSPFEVGGSSTGGWTAPADPAIFWKQWAFEQIGLQAGGSGLGRLAGDGVRVAVFDTSPFAPGVPPARLPEPINLTLAFPDLTNALPPAPVPTVSRTMTNPITVADHGLFSAGLIYAVAPQSQIHLVRVLNDYGCGDLWTLNNAINEWTSQQTKDERLDQVVLNLSLGVHQPRDFAKANWPAQIVSLNEALLNAHGRGAVIVAASGNDSYDSTTPRAMQLPADWEYVIGVAASNLTPDFACYSNAGDVLAPGADGGPWDDEACRPIAHTCKPDEADCPFGVVSLATQPEPGYRFWVGTSFAAPLVSGQAAMLLSSGIAAADVAPCILNTSTLDNGVAVVNVAASLAACSSVTSQ